MNRKQEENKEISVHWWNFGSKTLDFKGTYKEYLIKRDIKVNSIKNKYSGSKGYRFKIPLSSCSATLDIFRTDYSECCDEAIKIFLTLLGDKTLFDTERRTYKLNWN